MELKISRVTKQFFEKIAVDRVSLNMKREFTDFWG